MDGSETIPEAPEESEESEEEPDSEGEEQLLLLPTQASQLSQRVTNSQPSLASNSSLEGSQSQESSINRVSDNQPFPELSSGPFQEAESSSRKTLPNNKELNQQLYLVNDQQRTIIIMERRC